MLKKEEVEEIEQKKIEEKNKVIGFFKQREGEDGTTDFFSSSEVSHTISISVKTTAGILDDIRNNSFAGQLAELQSKGQTIKMGLERAEKYGTLYYGAKFYPQKKIL